MSAVAVHYVVVEIPDITSQSALVGVFRGLTGLEVHFDMLEYREGGNNDFVHRFPGRVTYPNLVCSWGMVNDETLLKWFMATHDQAQLKDVTLTLTAAKGDMTNVRKFVFADAYPVSWTGPQLMDASFSAENWAETLEIAHSGLKLT